MLKPNEGKKLEIDVYEKSYNRFPIRTEVFKNGDPYVQKICEYVCTFLKDPNQIIAKKNTNWVIIISEKIIAISQGRSYLLTDIKPRKLAYLLSKYVKKTPHGIGLGSAYTMELALREVGELRIIFAAIISVISKFLGFSGVFYLIAGREVACIDGPTHYSLYPSNVSAKLGPKNPNKVCEEIYENLKKELHPDLFMKLKGVVIIDANDLGRVVLGIKSEYKTRFFEQVMRDNPMGQGVEQTPIVIAVEK